MLRRSFVLHFFDILPRLLKLSSFTDLENGSILDKTRKGEDLCEIALLSRLHHLPEGSGVAG